MKWTELNSRLRLIERDEPDAFDTEVREPLGDFGGIFFGDIVEQAAADTITNNQHALPPIQRQTGYNEVVGESDVQFPPQDMRFGGV